MNTTIIGKRIRYERQRLDMTLKDLGNLLQVSEQCISGWEHGRNIPDIITLSALAKIFDITIESFLTSDILPQRAKERISNSSELPSSLSISKNDLQFLAKFHSLPKEKQNAMKVLLDITAK